MLLHLIESDHDTENYITVCLLCFRKTVVLTMNGDSPRIFNCWVYNFRIFCTACQYFFMVSFPRTKIECWNCHIATIWILKSKMKQFTESHMKDYSQRVMIFNKSLMNLRVSSAMSFLCRILRATSSQCLHIVCIVRITHFPWKRKGLNGLWLLCMMSAVCLAL